MLIFSPHPLLLAMRDHIRPEITYTKIAAKVNLVLTFLMPYSIIAVNFKKDSLPVAMQDLKNQFYSKQS